ncbi:MAG: dUTP pyrophosphatase [Nanoarchaeales archaeon]|nr:dUTP pyrophosphatase [Nanoarchaeales archaeon]
MNITKPYFKIKKFREDAIVPSKRKEDAGYDFYGNFKNDFEIFDSAHINLIPTGIGCEIPCDWVLLLCERGSTGVRGISKRAGVIDSGFRGEIFVALNNTSSKPIIFAKYEDSRLDDFLLKNKLFKDDVTIYPQAKAIAQGLLLYCPHVEVEVVEELNNNSERGTGTIGSSGK